MSQGAISEYDKDFKLIKKLNVGSLWGAVPLKNGNFLLQREGLMQSVEVNRNGETVWSATIAEVQSQITALAPGSAAITQTQTSERLSNGNTWSSPGFAPPICPKSSRSPRTRRWFGS